MKDYIQQATGTESRLDDNGRRALGNLDRDVHALFGLMTEVGELVDGYKRAVFYNQPLDTTNVVEKAGDILWYLAILLDVMGVSFEEVMEKNIAKLRARYPEKFTEKKAANRDLENERRGKTRTRK